MRTHRIVYNLPFVDLGNDLTWTDIGHFVALLSMADLEKIIDAQGLSLHLPTPDGQTLVLIGNHTIDQTLRIVKQEIKRRQDAHPPS